MLISGLPFDAGALMPDPKPVGFGPFTAPGFGSRLKQRANSIS